MKILGWNVIVVWECEIERKIFQDFLIEKIKDTQKV